MSVGSFLSWRLQGAWAPPLALDGRRTRVPPTPVGGGGTRAFETSGVVLTRTTRRASRARLSDPAKGSACQHRACCNYQVLRSYVGRLASGPKQCPLATCRARLQRTRDMQRDAVLQARLEQVPPDQAAVSFRDDEMRTSAPLAERPEASGKRKRSSNASSADNHVRSPRRRRQVIDIVL